MGPMSCIQMPFNFNLKNTIKPLPLSSRNISSPPQKKNCRQKFSLFHNYSLIYTCKFMHNYYNYNYYNDNYLHLQNLVYLDEI